MTQISEVHGIRGKIPADEYAGRGSMVTNLGYVPYLSLTKGEMELWLAAQRAKMLAQWYGNDAPQYAKACQLIENALHKGVHGGISSVGVVPDYLQNVAALIKSAERKNAPASRAMFVRPQGISGIGQIIPYNDRVKACLDAAKKLPALPRANAQAKCLRNFEIEKIFNGAIEKSGHHVLYHRIPSGIVVPTRVDVKRILHLGGIGGMAQVGEIDNGLMAGWVENGIIAKNAQIGVGAISSLRAAAEISPDPAQWIQRFTGQASGTSDKSRPGAGLNGIGIPAVVIIEAVTAALVAAKDLISALFKQQAVIKAEGFGTPAYSAEANDFLGGGMTTTTGGFDMKTLLLLGGAAALLLLAGDDNN